MSLKNDASLIQNEWQKCREDFQVFLDSYFKEDSRKLSESMLYTLKQGKKFRPFLTYASAKVFQDNTRLTLAYSVAVEMVHAFSLIHDDLPALDNDDERRGLATNHKVFGEDTAILSGDALLNEAYLLISEYYQENPKRALKLIGLLARAVGRDGMIEGQIKDLKAQKEKTTIEDLKEIHQLKTGCLIEAAILGPAIIYDVSKKEVENLKSYAKNLGLAFQIADDLLEKNIEIGSYPYLLGEKGALETLDEASKNALAALENFGTKAHLLRELVKENQNRQH